jgi:hypothetical protein
MNCTIPVLKINVDDCVGDSLGKHNYNALVLDTNICNLSGTYFNDPNNVNTILYSLSSYINNFMMLADIFDESKLERMLLASTRVKMLSSYWNKHEFTVQYPVNGSAYPDDTGNPLPINAPALSATDEQSINDIIYKKLNNLGKSYLLNNFQLKNYQDGTIINLVFLLYNLTPSQVSVDFVPSPETPDPSYLIVADYGPAFTYTNRESYANFTRDNIYLTQTLTLRYIKQNNDWNYFAKI